jgi:acetyltransferase-like isoleucine patch superfamily enzyme
LGNFVFIYPYVVFTNDPTPPSDVCIGPTIGDYSQIAVGSVILPGITIGQHCLTGAGSIVTKNVDDYQLVVGNPARVVKDVRDILDGNGQPKYPWPPRFDRGMPWSEIGYDAWLKSIEQ